MSLDKNNRIEDLDKLFPKNSELIIEKVNDNDFPLSEGEMFIKLKKQWNDLPHSLRKIIIFLRVFQKNSSTNLDPDVCTECEKNGIIKKEKLTDFGIKLLSYEIRYIESGKYCLLKQVCDKNKSFSNIIKKQDYFESYFIINRQDMDNYKHFKFLEKCGLVNEDISDNGVIKFEIIDKEVFIKIKDFINTKWWSNVGNFSEHCIGRAISGVIKP